MRHLNEPWTQGDLRSLVALAPGLDLDFAAEILNQASELECFDSRKIDKSWKARFLSHAAHCPPNFYGYKLWGFLNHCVRKAQVDNTAPVATDVDDWAGKELANSGSVTQKLSEPPLTNEGPRPPLNAEFLLHLLLPENRVDDVVGDLEERFRRKADRLGVRRAQVWYYKQIATSLWPYLKAAKKRLFSGATVKLVAFILRLVGQTSIADELISTRGVSNGKS